LLWKEAMPKPISLAQQIEEVEREIKLRESAFQSYGRSSKMRSSEAEFHIARMKAVLTTLRWLKPTRQQSGLR
jgi:hypothetical protein